MNNLIPRLVRSGSGKGRSMNRENKETPGAATPEETETISIDDYGKGSHALRELVSRIAELDPKLHSVNLLLE